MCWRGCASIFNENAVRKRHSREEVEQAFRRFDEQERLKLQPPSNDEDEEDDDSGDE